jgi:NAD(P)-dependent dehydrogenase (short-subunit alcohol dehydrogenase family)
MNPFSLEGKVILVTGATSGIGEASAKLFAKQGANVAVLGRNEKKTSKLAEEIGANAFGVVADLGNPEDMKKAFDDTVSHFGQLNAVFANAGTNGTWAPIEELTIEEWDTTLETNLRGPFLTVKYAIPHLRAAGGGAIVVNASVNGTRIFSNAGASAYSSSKAAQVAFTKMAALELADHKIRVNVLCPGAITTEIETKMETRNLDSIKEPVEFPEGEIPLTDGKPGTPVQVALLAQFLLSDASSHISGTEIWIDGAQSLLQG